MLKKYAERVKVTYEYMRSSIDFTDTNYKKIKQLRLKNEEQYKPQKTYTRKWEIDTTKAIPFSFLGYEASYKKSEVTTGNRLFYDRTKPFKKEVLFTKEYKSTKEIIIPAAYIIPKGFWPVIELLKSNGIQMQQIKKDTLIEVRVIKSQILKLQTPLMKVIIYIETQLQLHKLRKWLSPKVIILLVQLKKELNICWKH